MTHPDFAGPLRLDEHGRYVLGSGQPPRSPEAVAMYRCRSCPSAFASRTPQDRCPACRGRVSA